MKMFDVVCSLVIFKNKRSQLLDAINSFLNTELNIRLILIDNSPSNDLFDLIKDPRVDYVYNPSNPGYGTSHNIAIKNFQDKTKYHLILNPDIYYSEGVLEELFSFLEKETKIGLLMPKVLYPNGEIQYLAKLIPTPFTFFMRRLNINSKLKSRLSDKFELKFSNYDKIMDVPYLSGCFMLCRAKVLKKINGFDEKIFMHMEDLDITRRINEAGYRTVFYSDQFIIHDHIYKSLFTWYNIFMYFSSAIYYFNKWGWIFDKKRALINKQTIQNIKLKK
jgi:GT2 family glycosyltransferase|tara:strand:+ start:8086 stop:8916 length:831 start_codon:yes stop_codon:yes gene_type:complete